MSTFHPSLWGDFFLTYQPPSSAQLPQMKERAGALREQVRAMIKDSNEIPKILDLIMTLERLDVFQKFQDRKGDFVNVDTTSLLSLYNAAYLRTHGEELLDAAISFAKRRLLCDLELESPYAKEVCSTLDTPLFRRVGILETRSYISKYENDSIRNEAILEIAKLNFNILHIHFCEDLKDVTLWWKELYGKSNLSLVRERIVEVYFWMNGACYKPQYSHSRIILTKITAFITIVDDIFDTYGSTKESMQLQEAIKRWDESAVALLPKYMKNFYLYLLETFASFEAELGVDKTYRKLKQLVQVYADELKWRDEHYVPKTMSEHLEVSSTSIGPYLLACA
uniref:(+)-delta-cadinene synthase isozyme C2 n=1 Tax=Aegilops tauschii TaxID=37682 RepID=M8B2L9_AEGTA